MDESMTYRPTVIEPGNAGRGGGRRVISGAPSWGSSSNAVVTVALPSGKNFEEFKMALHPEQDCSGGLGQRCATSGQVL